MKEDNIKPVEYFAKKLDVSTRTIYSDLEKINKYIMNLGFLLERKKGLGIRLSKKDKKMKEIDEMEKMLPSFLGLEERRLTIIKQLLFENETVTLQQLADKFYVSKSSIRADFQFIKEHFLDSTTAMLISDMHGTRLEGSEEAYQNTFVLLNSFYEFYEHKYTIFNNSKDSELRYLEQLYGRDITTACKKIIYDFTKNNVEVVAEYYVNNLLNRVIVLVYRLKHGHHIEQSNKNADLNQNTVPYALLNKLSQLINVDFTSNDVAYLSKHMEANKMTEVILREDYRSIIEQVLYKMSDTLKVNLTNDKQIREQLAKHFPSMIYRVENNIFIQNPFVSQIKQEFGLMFNITWLVMSSIEEEMKLSFTENEIGFLVIYFQSAIDRLQASKKVLIICPTGITTSGLLLNRIKKILPPLDVIEVVSQSQFSKMDMEDIDFIISTTHLKVESKPTIVVSPLLSDEDRQNVLQFYNKHFVLDDNDAPSQDEPNTKHIAQYLDKSFIDFHSNFDSAEDLINQVTEQLYQLDYVTSDYRETVINREKMGGTELPTGAAVPHGNPQYVKRTTIGVYVNKKPIKWNEQHVSVIIFFCVAKHDVKKVKDLLKDIYSLVESKEMVERIFIHSAEKEFTDLLGGVTID